MGCEISRVVCVHSGSASMALLTGSRGLYVGQCHCLTHSYLPRILQQVMADMYVLYMYTSYLASPFLLLFFRVYTSME